MLKAQEIRETTELSQKESAEKDRPDSETCKQNEAQEETPSTQWKNRLRELRKAKGLSLRELADAVKMDYTTLAYIEKNKIAFSMKSLKCACDYFHVTPNEMLGVTEISSIPITEDRETTERSKDNKYIRITKPHGYVEAYYPESPMAKKDGWVPMHRLVMSLSLGRPLTKEEVVHHINGDPGDNRLSNLQLFSNNAEHLRWHAIQRRDEIIKSLLEQ